MYFWLIVGFLCLIKGADCFVDGSSSIAKLLRIPTIIIGLTVVAFGTSAPELAVSATAALKGANEIALSNVIGSNLFNLLIVVGVCAVISPVVVSKDILKRDFPVSILVTVVLLIFCLDTVIFQTSKSSLGRIDGLLLLVLFTGFLCILIRSALSSRTNIVTAQEESEIMPPIKSIIFIVIGLVGIIIGGDLVVNSASDIAASFGLSQSLIGLTIVAMGTSLPELVTSIVATRKGENDLSLGNVVGSNIFNILLILGISGFIHPIEVSTIFIYDLILLILFNLVIFLYCTKKKQVDRPFGIMMIVTYFAYMVYIILR